MKPIHIASFILYACLISPQHTIAAFEQNTKKRPLDDQLLDAARNDVNVKRVKKLLEEKASVHHSDGQGDTALHFAIRMRAIQVCSSDLQPIGYALCTSPDIVGELLLAGANPQRINYRGESYAKILNRNRSADSDFSDSFGKLHSAVQGILTHAYIKELQTHLLAPLAQLVLEYENRTTQEH